MEQIVKQMVSKRNKLNLSVPKLSLVLDIPADRIYKWEQDKGNPKGSDIDKINQWLEDVPKVPQVEEPTPYGAWDKIADSNQRLARSMEIMANLLQEKEATMKEIKASLAQIPEDMIALSAKLLEGQQHIYSLVGQVKDEVKKPHGKAPAPLKKR